MNQIFVEAGKIFGGIVVGIFIRSKLWWGALAPAKKKEAVAYIAKAIEDGKITVDEFMGFVYKYT